MASIEENIAKIRSEIRQAARSVGRDPETVTLLAATKTRGPEEIARALPYVDACGENRVQEFTEKRGIAYGEKPVHFIGHLQTNKVKYIVGRCDLIHSVDSLHLAQAVSSQAEKLGIRQDCLLEVNIGGEENKTGCPEGELYALAEAAVALPGLRVRGLMTVPPKGTPEEAGVWFGRMKELYDSLSPLYGYDTLSMGMTGDYAAAVRAGATVVRIGTGIFGPRNYK